mmetsp:Transcript_23926/g.56255  ORF Transcript_23926/g.56255 Transcript_23926/m.56255 type:complete len:215 (+) Transcript_23926:788-1432(+)
MLAALGHISVYGLESLVDVIESIVELLGPSRLDLVEGGSSIPRLGLGIGEFVVAFLDTIGASIELVAGTKIGRHTIDLGGKLIDVILEFLAKLLLVSVTEALPKLTIELLKIDASGVLPILDDLDIVALRKVSGQIRLLRHEVAEATITAGASATASGLFHLFVFVVIVVATLAALPRSALRAGAGLLFFLILVLFVVGASNERQIHLINSGLL